MADPTITDAVKQAVITRLATINKERKLLMTTREEEEIISMYTREQAIEDGFLVDVTALAREAGFKWPVVVTRRVWDEVVTPDPCAQQGGQSEQGRLWDVLWMARLAAKASKADRDFVSF